MLTFKKVELLYLIIIFFVNSIIEADELPNILWITSEDNGPHLGCYGDNYSVSPNIDALANIGLRYTNAISTAPVCAPARTTIISGIYPTSTGSQHMRSLTTMPKEFKMFPQFLREHGYYCTNNQKEDFNLTKPGIIWDELGEQAHWEKRGKGQPFFAIFNHTITHESQIRNEIDPEDKIHDPDQVGVPTYHPNVQEVRSNWSQYYDRITMMDKRVGENLKALHEAGLTENTIIFYFGDHGSGMPRSKRWPNNSGLNIPLIIHFPEKWKHLAPKEYLEGGTSDRLVGFIDLAPTLLSIAGIQAPDWMQGHAFAGNFEAKEPKFSFGFRGRMDERIDMVRTVRGKRFIYIRNYMPHRIYGQHVEYMFKTQSTQIWYQMFTAGELNDVQSKFWQTKPFEELYDLQKDHDEVNNLAESTDHKEIIAKMRKAHRKHVRDIRDLGFLSEWEILRRAEVSGLTPYEMGHSTDIYDFETIYNAAQLACSNDGNVSNLIELLNHDDSGVRYWAAIGLLVRGELIIRESYKQLLVALNDKSPIVQITAAEIIGRFGANEDIPDALDILLTYIDPVQSAYLGIAAWNALDYIDEHARSKYDQIVAISDQPINPPARYSGYAKRLKKKVLKDLDKGINSKSPSKIE